MQKRDALTALTAASFLGFSIVFISFATKSVHPFVFMTISCLVSVPMLFLVSLLFPGEGLRETLRNRKDFLVLFSERTVLAQILLVSGLSLTLAVRSVFLVQLEAAFVFLWGVLLFGEKAGRKSIFSLLLLTLGAFLITTGGDLRVFQSFLVGDLLIIIALVFLSHTYFVSARLMEKANPLKLTMSLMALGAPVFASLSYFLVPGVSFLPEFHILLVIIAAVVSFNVIGLPLWLHSLRRVKPWVLASLIVVQTIAGAALSFFWLGQTLTPVQLAGGGLILISVYLISSRG